MRLILAVVLMSFLIPLHADTTEEEDTSDVTIPREKFNELVKNIYTVIQERDEALKKLRVIQDRVGVCT